MMRERSIRAAGFAACVLLFATIARVSAQAPPTSPKPVAILIADWLDRSHPEVLFSHLLRTYSRDGKGLPPQPRVASLYRDLPSHHDLSQTYAARHGFPVVDSIERALTLGTGKLAVDGVLISTEWAPYPESDTGQ